MRVKNVTGDEQVLVVGDVQHLFSPFEERVVDAKRSHLSEAYKEVREVKAAPKKGAKK